MHIIAVMKTNQGIIKTFYSVTLCARIKEFWTGVLFIYKVVFSGISWIHITMSHVKIYADIRKFSAVASGYLTVGPHCIMELKTLSSMVALTINFH